MGLKKINGQSRTFKIWIFCCRRCSRRGWVACKTTVAAVAIGTVNRSGVRAVGATIAPRDRIERD